MMNSDFKPKLRFAPSPNGYMHLGHAYSALLNVEIARAMGAKYIIRMEDIDQLRCTSVYKVAWLEDLAGIGANSDAEILYQSERQGAYEVAIERLTELGVLYPCLATRGDIKRHYESHEKQFDPDGALIYPNLYKGLSLIDQRRIISGNVAFALRLDMAAALEIMGAKGEACSFLSVDLAVGELVDVACDPLVWGDVIVARKDIGTSYHLSVVVDDAMQDISHIVRGVDLYKATYIHSVLQALLGLVRPVYYHHKLLLDGEMNKLAKSNNSQAVREILAQNMGLDFISDLLERQNMRNMAEEIVRITCEKHDQ